MNATLQSLTPDLVAGSIKKHLSSGNGVSSGDLFKVPRHMIRILPGYNVRETSSPSYQARVRTIAELMKKHGFKVTEPLSGFVAREPDGDVFYMTRGHTRLAAFDLAVSEGAGLTPEIPAIPMPRGTDRKALTADLHISNSGTPLSLLELGTVCQRMLLQEGLSDEQVVAELGITKKQLDDAVLLRTSPKAVQQLVIEEKVSATTALNALRTKGSGAAEYLQQGLERAAAGGKTRATGKHFAAPSWNRRVIEKGLTTFREKQRTMGVDEQDILPDDPLAALRMLLKRVYPQLEQDANLIGASA